MPALITHQSEAPKKISIDEDTDSKSREIAWSPIFFAVLKCPCLS